MRFALLGPLEISDDGPVEVRGVLRRTLLARLLLDAGRTVPSDELVELLWGGKPPASGLAVLYNQVNRLRQNLGGAGDRVVATAAGYRVEVEPGELDLEVFATCCAAGRTALAESRWADAAESFSRALALWRGRPLAGLPALEDHLRIRQLEEERFQALESRIHADLSLGPSPEVIGELRTLVRGNPLREALAGRLMQTLARVGRRDEALEVYRSLSEALGELGMEPTPELREIRRGLVAGAAVVQRSAARAAAVSGPGSQLPADTRFFCGRQRELDEIGALIAPDLALADEGGPTVIAIDGPAGVGKSALAIRAAHQAGAEFADGQLFVDLHGYTPGLDPIAADDALAQLLRLLGVPPQMIPKDPAERAAHYRARLAGTRTLIVLDNAVDAAQVRPLLPDAPGCLVIITSRRRLSGLDDARAFPLEPLSGAEAAELLAQVAGPGRIPDAAPAVDELIDFCGRIPLALRISAARLRHRMAVSVEELVDELRDEHKRLERIRDDDRNLIAVFDSSYRALGDDEKRMFRRLGLVPGPDFDAYAAAALDGGDPSTAADVLEALLDQNLIQQHVDGRHRFHDLVRLHAREVVGGSDEQDSAEAFGRLLDYYERGAREADRHFVRHSQPAWDRHACQTPSAPVALPELAERKQATAWMRAELENLLSAADQLAATGSARLIALGEAMSGYLVQALALRQADTLYQASAQAARGHGDRIGEANALVQTGSMRVLGSDFKTAAAPLEQALEIYRGLGERLGEANALRELGRVHRMTGDLADGAVELDRALGLYQDLGDTRGEANTSWIRGAVRHATGDMAGAIALMGRAGELFRVLGDDKGLAISLALLARSLRDTGDYRGSGEALSEALEIFREIGPKVNVANALCELGRLRLVSGDYADAELMQNQALEIFTELGIHQETGYVLWDLGRIRQAVGDHVRAREFQDRALPIFENNGDRIGVANVVHSLGQLSLAAGDHAAAERLLDRAASVFGEVGDRHGCCEVLASRAELAAATRGAAAAAELYAQAVEIAREIGILPEEARARFGRARCAAALGERDAALDDLRRAADILTRIGSAEAAAATEYLASLERSVPEDGDLDSPRGTVNPSGPISPGGTDDPSSPGNP
jgi:DNA-binding SARP family transcriptional activator/tetratricopeptide (TPR) repeat protein